MGYLGYVEIEVVCAASPWCPACRKYFHSEGDPEYTAKNKKSYLSATKSNTRKQEPKGRKQGGGDGTRAGTGGGGEGSARGKTGGSKEREIGKDGGSKNGTGTEGKVGGDGSAAHDEGKEGRPEKEKNETRGEKTKKEKKGSEVKDDASGNRKGNRTNREDKGKGQNAEKDKMEKENGPMVGKGGGNPEDDG
ncbi:hypothetical protein CBR_g45357 [Chara braunii]|uniref:Uncharacterized protein n=1 Tax=Chara braunii TaxID=69332 RepID=A0A388LY97_CHABU|nr:hypothetical protein CBR_g45357 [Chara braunii]|eukprot:GBG87298.1 hypothetical protein CBR_g45357 [Chara braunii]